ncbi:MAG TPA: hypothetical protein V6C76_07260 [Drouetiella sp.]
MSLKILTVFDCSQAVEWVSQTLVSHELTQVGTIMAAMQILQKDKVDVILVQLHLQNESLFDLLRSIRRNDFYRSMSFICCETSRPTREPHIEAEFLEKSCLLYGATKVLPIDRFYCEELEHEINETVSGLGSRNGTK